MGFFSFIFLTALTAIAVDKISGSNLHLSRDVKILRTAHFPCSAVEISRRAHDVQPSAILILEVSLAVDPKEEYDELYGINAHRAPTHADHYKCFFNYAETLRSVKKRAFESLAEAMEINQESYNGEREKRSLSLPVALAVANLAATAGVGFYAGLSLHDLEVRVSHLEELVAAEEDFSDAISRNVRVLRENGNTVALRANILSQSFLQYRRYATCDMFRARAAVERLRLFSRLHAMRSDLLSSRLSPDVIPISLLRNLLKEVPDIISGTLLQGDPLAFYKKATVSLLAVNVEAESIRLLLAVPRITKTPSFRELRFLSPNSVVKASGRLRGRRLRKPKNLFIPMEVYNGSPDFCLKADSIEKMRRLEGCDSVKNRLVCETSAPVPESDRNCVEAFVTNGSSSHHCDINEYEVDEKTDVTFDRGVTGILVNFPSAFTVYGTTLSGTKERILLSPPSAVDLRTCLFIPAKYSMIQLLQGKKEVTIRQQLRLVRDLAESTSEAAFYPLESAQWDDEEVLGRNVSLKDIESMIRRHVAHPYISSGHSVMFHVTWVLVVALAITLCILGWICRKFRKGEILSRSAYRGDKTAESK